MIGLFFKNWTLNIWFHGTIWIINCFFYWYLFQITTVVPVHGHQRMDLGLCFKFCKCKSFKWYFNQNLAIVVSITRELFLWLVMCVVTAVSIYLYINLKCPWKRLPGNIHCIACVETSRQISNIRQVFKVNISAWSTFIPLIWHMYEFNNQSYDM